jgi:predicted dehydrogenase
MRALVTGATGFIGRHLVAALLAREHTVRVLARDPKKAAQLGPAVDVRLGNLADADTLAELCEQTDIIFHLGAAIQGPWERHRLITVEGTRRLLHAAAAAGARRFIFASSLAVYDKMRLLPQAVISEESPQWEDLDIAGPYARGKIEAECLLRQQAPALGIEYIIVRPGLVYGPGHVIFEHLGVRLGRGTFIPIGGSKVRLPLVHIDSVTDALLRLADAPAAAGGAFNIVDDEQISKREYLRQLSRANCRRYRCLGIPAGPLAAAARATERLRHSGRAPWLPRVSARKLQSRMIEYRYDCSALRRATGWRPAHDLPSGLLATFRPAPAQRASIAVRRVGIIGAGRIADFHIAALQRLRDVQVTGILDISPAAAAAVAARFNIPLATSDSDEFYQQAQPQCVHILTPPHSHASLALDAIRRGAHLLVEKPITLTVNECDLLRAAAAERGIVVGVDHNLTADPRICRARRLIDSSAIGDLVHIDIVWAFDIRRFQHMLAQSSAAGEPWPMQLPGGPLEDLAPHPLSLALWLVNEEVHPVSTHSFRSGRLEHAFDDELRLMLAGRHATASVCMSLSAAPDDVTVTIYGTRSTVRLDLQNLLMIESRQGPGPKAIARGLRVLRGGFATLAQTARNTAALALKRIDPPGSPAALIAQHYEALTTGAPLPADLEQGRRVVQLIRAIWPAPELSSSPAGERAPTPTTRDANVTSRTLCRGLDA